ncbi:MAG TPA: hypothetical protein VEA40_10075 [Ramlibacter sp.]|nr:hypothetical protein [Ramlibacter sp.]
MAPPPLTSKEVLERTGISRATLNNYIATGLLPRPDVLPPNPEDGDAPRIGYFPPDTIDRIAEIQRRKREGWSIAQIAAHFAGGPAPAPARPSASEQRPPPPPAQPAPVAAATPAGNVPRSAPAPAGFPSPVVTPVAVLVTTLQDAGRLWLTLPAREYFELVHDIWRELDTVFRRLGGRHGSHPGEGMVCHFLPGPDADYVWSALRAATQSRDAISGLSHRWQARKGWDVQLCLNTGIDEGREWLAPLRLAEPVEPVVVGGAADHAAQLSRLSRSGAIWITRNALDRLPAAQRTRVTYGVPRPGAADANARVLASFAPLAELAAQAGIGALPTGLADLPVTELLQLAEPASPASPGAPGA